ncbi:unnamed protein product [Cuscuta epithymum]|uniref:GRF-type domain-containing protein n=1 Tax=Cuscuta epithymum TaxID=186058 RepID=A0AAV0FPF3_9ASTE|nr:unnamed protein product [Cuscuta epithymum]
MSYGNCYCGIPAKILTSWTNDNPGRRFLACSRGTCACCNMFEWLDEEICYRSKMIIPGLLRKINRLEAELADEKAREKGLSKKQMFWSVLWFILAGLMVVVIWAVCYDNRSKKMVSWKMCDAGKDWLEWKLE